MNAFLEVYERRSVLWQLVTQQLILRYRRTLLGYFWTLINPLLMMAILSIVFSSLFGSDPRTFAVFLFAGMVPWNFFNAVVIQSSTSLIGNEGLIRKIRLPKVLFPLSVAVSLLIDSALSFVALFIVMLLLGASVSWSMLFLPVAYALLAIFAFGAGLLTAITTVFFRDTQHVILIAMQGLFFLTPVFYRQESIAGRIGWIVNLNPVIPFIDMFRQPLVQGMVPASATILHAGMNAVIVLAAGLLVFLRMERQIIFRL